MLVSVSYLRNKCFFVYKRVKLPELVRFSVKYQYGLSVQSLLKRLMYHQLLYLSGNRFCYEEQFIGQNGGATHLISSLKLIVFSIFESVSLLVHCSSSLLKGQYTRGVLLLVKSQMSMRDMFSIMTLLTLLTVKPQRERDFGLMPITCCCTSAFQHI